MNLFYLFFFFPFSFSYVFLSCCCLRVTPASGDTHSDRDEKLARSRKCPIVGTGARESAYEFISSGTEKGPFTAAGEYCFVTFFF